MRDQHDLANEKLLTIPEAAQCVPGERGKRGVSTLWRWIAKGARGVKLESVLIGGKRYTSEEALARFIARVTSAADRRKQAAAVAGGRQD
jgi:hypothetical protein